MFKTEMLLFFSFTFYKSDSWMCMQLLLGIGENDQIHSV